MGGGGDANRLLYLDIGLLLFRTTFGTAVIIELWYFVGLTLNVPSVYCRLSLSVNMSGIPPSPSSTCSELVRFTCI